MRFKRNREDEIKVGIAPLVDIVFLLLIFFMVTSHFDVASGVRIQLPKVSRKTYDEKDEKITLIIDKAGRVYLDGKVISDDGLKKKLEYMVNEKGIVHLILQADKEVRHGKVVRIMDLAKTAGVRSIIIAAQWNPEKVF